MSTIVTRAGKGASLSWTEADANFTNLNADKLEVAAAATTYAPKGATTSSGLTVATAKLLGRTTAGTGAIEELSVGSGLSLTGGVLDSSGVVSGTFSLTGDISPSQITANQNDYNPTGLSTASVLRLNTDASRDITGLQGGADGRLIVITNVGSFAMVLKDESGSSTAANRFALAADITLATDQSVVLQYDSTSSRWRAVAAPSASVTPIDKIVQVVEGTPYVTYSSTAVAIPFDDTIPQSGEGAQWNSVTITPTSATNRLLIEAEFSLLMSSGADTATAALFQDSTANALAASSVYIPGSYQEPLRVSHEMAAGTTSATTFKVRAGLAAGTLYVNGDTGARKYGGVSAVRIRVTEIKV